MPKPKRIFIAVNLPQESAQELAQIQDRWPGLPCRWVKEENLHLTLAFLGNTGKNEVQEIEKAVKTAVKEYKPFSVELEKVCYGPPKKMPPSLVWIKGRSGKLVQLKKELDKNLAQNTGYRPERRRYIPHITLGRIKKFEWRRLNPGQRPKVALTVDHTFKVESIDIMESELKRSGPEYTMIQSIKLGDF